MARGSHIPGFSQSSDLICCYELGHLQTEFSALRVEAMTLREAVGVATT